jgi:hypothetical protein
MLRRISVASTLEGDRMTGIVTEGKAGREALLANVVIDANRNADVAYGTGALVTKPPREEMIAARVMFHPAASTRPTSWQVRKRRPQTYADWAGGRE